MKTGEALKKARTDAGITQAELAKRLGVTPQTVSQYERGIKKPKVETLARFADAMSVSIDSLLDESTRAQIEGNTHQALVSAMATVSASAGKLTDAGIPEDEVQDVMGKLKNLVEFALQEADLQEMLRLYQSLNREGQAVALERLDELAQLSKYQRQDPKEVHAKDEKQRRPRGFSAAVSAGYKPHRAHTTIMTGENMEELYNQLAALAGGMAQSGLCCLAPVPGDNRPNSDIDLAVYGMPEDNRAEFWMHCEELPTLLKFDIVHIQDGMEPVFLANIERDGVELMDKLHEKYDRFTAAVARLREALDDYKKFPLDSVRDGTIQRFEFCTELAWKTMREYLLDQGYTNINSPKEVIKQAFAFGMIDDQKAWVELLNDRNLTSHVYDEATAAAIFARIEGQYLPLFDRVTAYMKDE